MNIFSARVQKKKKTKLAWDRIEQGPNGTVYIFPATQYNKQIRDNYIIAIKFYDGKRQVQYQ